MGLFWLDKGDNTFGRAPSNRLVLDHPALAPQAGTFKWDAGGVHFTAHPGSGITHGGQPVSSLDMVMDSQGEPTVVSSGPLRFFIIERSGKVGVRVRDIASPAAPGVRPDQLLPRGHATGFSMPASSPTSRIGASGSSTSWGWRKRLTARARWYSTRTDTSTGWMRCWRARNDQTLFVMFGDRTNGKGSYGGGRFLHTPLPSAGHCAGGFQPGVQPTLCVQQFRDVPAATGSEQTGAAGGGR